MKSLARLIERPKAGPGICSTRTLKQYRIGFNGGISCSVDLSFDGIVSKPKYRNVNLYVSGRVGCGVVSGVDSKTVYFLAA